MYIIYYCKYYCTSMYVYIYIYIYLVRILHKNFVYTIHHAAALALYTWPASLCTYAQNNHHTFITFIHAYTRKRTNKDTKHIRANYIMYACTLHTLYMHIIL